MRMRFFHFRLLLLGLSLLASTSNVSAQDPLEIDSLQKALQEQVAAKNDTLALRTIYTLSKAYWDDDVAKADSYAVVMLEMAQKAGNKRFEGMANRCRGIVCENLGKYPEALQYYQNHLRLATEAGAEVNIGTALADIGDVYKGLGIYDKALVYHYRSIQNAEKLNRPKAVAQGFNSVGIIYDLLHKPQEALKFYYASLKVKMEIGDQKGIANTCMNIGLIYEQEKKFDKALGFHRKALRISEELFNEQGVGSNEVNIANCYYKQGNKTAALRYYLSAAQHLEKVQSNFTLISAYVGLGDCYQHLKDYEKAEYYAQKALTLSKETHTPENLEQSYSLLHRLDSAQGRFQSSLKNYKLSVAWNDTLLQDRNTEQLVTTKLEYEFDRERKLSETIQQGDIKTRNTIAIALAFGLALIGVIAFLLYRRASFIRQVQAQTQRNLEEKEVLLREIHHRVKNNLAVISGLLYLQKNRVDDETIKGVLLEGQNRIDSMVLVHEMLYQSNNIAEIDLKSYLEKLIGQIAAGFEGKNYFYSINGSATLEPKQAVPLGLILTELITNIYKYAYPDQTKGEFSVQIEAMNEAKLKIILQDRGKGLPANFDPAKSKTLGLKLVNLLCQQMNANISFDADNGTKVLLYFTVKKEPKI